MKKHFILQHYIEDEAEDEDECSKDEDEIDDTKIDTQIINVKAILNEEKNRRKNREKYNQEQIKKDESIIKKILKRSYKAKTQEHNSNLFIKKKSSYWLDINKKALILSQKTTNESQSPARIVQKIRVGFKCNKNEKKNDIIEMKSNDKGNEEIDELKKKVEKKIKEKISETSSENKRNCNNRIKENRKILENVITINEDKKKKKEKIKHYNPFCIPNRNTSLLQEIKDNKLNSSQEGIIQNNANIININNYFTQSKPISTSNSSLSLSMKIKISTIFN